MSTCRFVPTVLAVLTTITAASLVAQVTNPPGQQSPVSAVEPPGTGIITWQMGPQAKDNAIVARLTTGILNSRPYFDSVRVRREYAGALINCASFGAPSVTENGVNRIWIYRMEKPRAGPCSAPQGGRFVVVGTKDGVLHSAAPAP